MFLPSSPVIPCLGSSPEGSVQNADLFEKMFLYHWSVEQEAGTTAGSGQGGASIPVRMRTLPGEWEVDGGKSSLLHFLDHV